VIVCCVYSIFQEEQGLPRNAASAFRPKTILCGFVFSFEALQLLGYLWQLLVCVRGMSLLRLSFQPRASGGVAVREDQMISVNKAQRTLAGFASTLSPPSVEI
jgi:hypothetical protein